MTTSEKLIKIAENVQKNVEFGKSQGGTNDLWSYAKHLGSTFYTVAFPEGYEATIETLTAPSSMNGCFWRTTGIKKVTLICKESGSMDYNQLARESSIEIFDITNFKTMPTKMSYFAASNKALTSIVGILDMSACTEANNAFNGTTALKDIGFKEGTISIALDFRTCTKLSAESYDSIIKGYSKEASVTLTLPKEATVRSVYDAKFGSGAWDAITAQYPNVTIMYS